MKNFLLFIFSLFIINNTNGQNWVEQTNPLGFGEDAMLGKIHFVSDTEGWISCGKGGFLHTTNGGSEWIYINPFPSDTLESFSDPAVSMSWIGTTHGWNIGTIGGTDNPQGAVIYRTTNGGAGWDKIILSSDPGVMGIGVQFVDVNNGWAVIFSTSSGQGSFLKTTDGGNNWVPQNGIGLFYFLDANNGWAYTGTGPMGENPPYSIHRTTNGGENWTEQFSDNTAGRFNSIRFSDLNNGWVVGETGKVLKTTNGGANWNFVANSGINTNASCKNVFSLGGEHVWIPSKDNTPQQTPFIQYSPNGGSTWGTQITPFGNTQGSNAIFSIFFVNPNLGWLTADYGRIAKYTGTTSVDDQINNVINFSLEQNYPNPFNPSTSIKFKIPESGYTTIKVYNILGSEVATLLNEMKQPGIYEVSFDAAGLSSGTYFYAMESGTFREVRKMVILK